MTADAKTVGGMPKRPPAEKLAVFYTDGTEEETAVTTPALVAAERRWKNQRSPDVERSLFIAWVGLGKPNPTGLNVKDEELRFAGWFPTVDAIVPFVADEDEEDPEDPTPPGPGTGTSAS